MGFTAMVHRVIDQLVAYQDINDLIDRDAAGVKAVKIALGGSRSQGVIAGSAQPAPEYLEVELDGTVLAGLNVTARVQVRTANSATSVTPRIRNITAGSNAGAGSACTATNTDYSGTAQKQTIALTLVSGLNTYRLELTGGNSSAEVFGIGHLDIEAA